MRNRNFRNYRIDDLLPTELPRRENLDFYADLWTREGSLDRIDRKVPPRVEFPYVGDGNQRVIFLLLNDIEILRAEELDLGDEEMLRGISDGLRSRGIRSFRDLVTIIPFPERYKVIKV